MKLRIDSIRFDRPVVYVSAMLGMLLAAGVLNHIRDRVVTPEETLTFLENIRDSTLVGLPFSTLLMLLIAKLSKVQHLLKKQALTDQLTNLPNRRAFYDYAETIAGGAHCVGIVDVDHFKKVNDTYGHKSGDMCLADVAAYLQDWVGPDNFVCRYGGEEFAVVFPHQTIDQLMPQAQVIAQGQEFDIEDGPLRVSMSIGLAMWSEGETLDTALSFADQALYLAKSGGRACAERFPTLELLVSAPSDVSPVRLRG